MNNLSQIRIVAILVLMLVGWGANAASADENVFHIDLAKQSAQTIVEQGVEQGQAFFPDEQWQDLDLQPVNLKPRKERKSKFNLNLFGSFKKGVKRAGSWFTFWKKPAKSINQPSQQMVSLEKQNQYLPSLSLPLSYQQNNFSQSMYAYSNVMQDNLLNIEYKPVERTFSNSSQLVSSSQIGDTVTFQKGQNSEQVYRVEKKYYSALGGLCIEAQELNSNTKQRFCNSKNKTHIFSAE